MTRRRMPHIPALTILLLLAPLASAAAAPTLQSATAEGGLITLTYDAPLDPDHQVLASAFKPSARTITRAYTFGQRVGLEVAPPFAPGDPAITLSYTPPQKTRVQTLAGESAPAFARRAVTNATAAPTIVIDVLPSSAPRMAPHVVHATVAAKSTPGNGPLSTCRIQWTATYAGTTHTIDDPRPTHAGRTIDLKTQQEGFHFAYLCIEPGQFTLNCTITNEAGVSASARPVTINILPDKRALRFVNASAGNDVTGNGSISKPWRSLAKAVTETSGSASVRILLEDDQTFVVSNTSALASAANVIFDRTGDGTKPPEIQWRTNPGRPANAIDILDSCENVGIHNITFGSTVPAFHDPRNAARSKNANRGSGPRLRGRNGWVYNCNFPGNWKTGCLSNMADVGSDPAPVPLGVYFLKCAGGQFHNYGLPVINFNHLALHGVTIGRPLLEHCCRFVGANNRAPNLYSSVLGCSFDYGAPAVGTFDGFPRRGAGSLRVANATYHTTLKSYLANGATDAGYHFDTDGRGLYQPARYHVIDRNYFRQGNGANVEFCVAPEPQFHVFRANVFDARAVSAGGALIRAGPTNQDPKGDDHVDHLYVLRNTFHFADAITSGARTIVLSERPGSYNVRNVRLEGNLFSHASPFSGNGIVHLTDYKTQFLRRRDNVYRHMPDDFSYARLPGGTFVCWTDLGRNYPHVWPRSAVGEKRETIPPAAMPPDYNPDPATHPVTAAAVESPIPGTFVDYYDNPLPQTGPSKAGAVTASPPTPSPAPAPTLNDER